MRGADRTGGKKIGTQTGRTNMAGKGIRLRNWESEMVACGGALKVRRRNVSWAFSLSVPKVEAI